MMENQALRSSSLQPRLPLKNPKETSQASPNTKSSTQGTQIDTSQLDLGLVNIQQMAARPKHRRNASNNVIAMNTMGPGASSGIKTKRALNRQYVSNAATKKTSVSQILGTDNLMTSIGLQQAQFGQNSIINQRLLNEQFQKSIMINRQESQRIASLQNTPQHLNTQVNNSYLHDQNQESTEEGSTALGGANPNVNMNNISIQEHFQSYAMGDQSLINGSLNTTNQMIMGMQASGSKSTRDPYAENSNTNGTVHKFLHQEQSQEKYSRPYPGYAFEFENIDSYTKQKLPPMGAFHGKFQKKAAPRNEQNTHAGGPTIESTEVDEIHTNTGNVVDRTNPGGVSSLHLSSQLPSKHYKSTYHNGPHTFRTANEPLYNSSIQQDENATEIKTSRRNIPVSTEGKSAQQSNDKELQKSFRDTQQLQLELHKVDQSFGPRNTLLNLPNENPMLPGNRSSISRGDFQDSRASKHIVHNHQRKGGASPPSRGETQKEQEDFKRQVGITEKRRLNDLPKIKFKILCEDEDQIQTIIRQQRAEFLMPQERYTQSQNVSKRVPPTIRTTNDALAASQQVGASVKTARNHLIGGPLLGSKHDQYGPMFGDTSSQLVKSTKNIALYQAQRFKVNRNKVDYFYNTKESEFPEEMLTLSGGNKYHERNNPQVAKFINGVQGNIKVSNQKKTQMKEGLTKIFAKMKKEKKQYLGTLLEGEEMGHCTGIKVRTDESKQVQQRQKNEKYRQNKEEKEAEVKAEKLRRDNEKLAAKRMRIQERLNMLDSLSTIPAKKKGESFLNSFKSQLKGNLKVKNQGLASGENLLQGTPNDNLNKTATLTQKVRIQIADDAKKDEKEHDDELLVPDGEGTIELQPVVQFQDQVPQTTEDRNKLVAEFNNVSTSLPRKGSQHRDGAGVGNRVPSPYKKGDKKNPNTQQSSKKSKVIAQGLNLKLSPEQVKVIEQEIRDDPTGQFGKLFKYFENSTPPPKREVQSKTPGGGNQHKAHSEIFKGSNGSKQLGFDNCPDMQAYFKTMCEEDTTAQIKFARLKSPALQTQLQDRYCTQVGERIFKFLENEFHSLCRVFFRGQDGFLDVISKFLNAGPEMYKKFMFACCSLTNQGRICEHDIFTLLEQFKQRESFFFYQDLILQKEVPRDYKNVIDNSDSIFFQAFAKDVKLISHMLMMKKRMMGIVDQDTNSGIETDFDLKMYPGSQEQMDEDLIRQIDFIISVIHEKGGSVLWNDAFETMRDNKDLIQLRNKLCEFVAYHGLVKEKQQQTQRQSQLSVHSDSKKKKSLSQQKKNPANQSGISFNNTGCKNPCLGPGKYKRTGNPVTECIFITWKEFNKFLSFRKQSGGEIPSIAEDFIKTISLGKINLRHFERSMALYRDPNGPEYTGTLYDGAKILDGSAHAQQQTQQSNTAKKAPPSKTQFKTTEGFAEINASGDLYVPKHVLNQEFTIQDSYCAGEFGGKMLIRTETAETKKKRTQLALGEQQQAQDGSPPKVDKDQDDDKQEKSKANDLILTISADQCKELHMYKECFGPENFYNIFRCFYLLSQIPADADNNPFALYIDQASIVRGFFVTFGVNYEEVAIRLFNLFVEPPKHAKSYRIELTRFYHIVYKMCELHTPDQTHLKYAFKFYDYDQNGSIGSVDIVNLFKYFPTAKVEKIFRKFDSCYQKQQEILAEKKKLNKNLSFADYQTNKLDPSKLFNSENISDSDREAPPDQTDSQESDDGEVKSDDDGEQNQSGSENEDDNNASKKASSKNVTKNLLMDRKELYQQLKSKTFSDDEDNMISQSINNRWNRVLLETKCLRNYFVDEAVVPSKKVTAADQNFLNKKMFEGHFLSMMKERYGVETPAILHFFRDRFICCQYSANKKFGSSMMADVSGQMSLSIIHNTNNLNLESMYKDMGQQMPRYEYMSMLRSLQILSNVPRGFSSLNLPDF